MGFLPVPALEDRLGRLGLEAAQEVELLQTAENGRYKVVAKAEPYKNLPVSFENCTWK